MTDLPPSADAPPPAARRLDSWKDIAAYLGRDVSTVQRWEKREGMPVHRHLHDKQGSVYAFSDELDAWWRGRQVQLRRETPPELEQDQIPAPGDAALQSSRARPLGVVVAFLVIAMLAVTLVWMARAPGRSLNPLEDARFVPVTDFEGNELAAAISRDGRFIAFLSDRDGPTDVWVTQIGTGRFTNLTAGKQMELANPDIRTLGFSPDGSLVTFWVRREEEQGRAVVGVWAVPTLGGEPALYFDRAAELDWSSDGTRLVFHTADPGDPMFLGDRARRDRRHLFTAPEGLHNHYQVWSPDDGWIWFVQGSLPDRMDLWRIAAGGGVPERMTRHDAQVSDPTFLDGRTVVYLATDADGGGPWMHVLDVDSRESRRVSIGTERYASLSGSAGGRRLAVTVANPRRTLWRVPIGSRVSGDTSAMRLEVPGVGGRAPRAGLDYLLYVSSRGEGDSIWKLSGGSASEFWSIAEGRIVGGPAISRDGRRIAFTAEERGRRHVYVMSDDGSGMRTMPEALQPRSAPAWSPDGTAIAVAGLMEGRPILARITVADGTVTPIVAEVAEDPVWSPDGNTIFYSGPEVGTVYSIRAVAASGGVSEARLTLSRGTRRVALLPNENAVVVLRGDMTRKNFWAIDLGSGIERRLTDFSPDFVIRDFDVSPDGAEIVFDREQDDSDIVLVELPDRRE